MVFEIAENYVIDQNENQKADTAPIASVISNYCASMAVYRGKTLTHPIPSENIKGLIVLKEALQLNCRWWGLAGKLTRLLLYAA
jgi:hypothetical protein